MTRIEPRIPKPGWTAVSMDDKVPVCAFAGYPEWEKATTLKQVKKQKLHAKATLRFGAYAPWCVNEKCDQIPSLQCWTELAGNTITVHTHYAGEHKDGSACSECKPITAGCETPVLEAGTYTAKHGDKTLSLKLPGVLRSPCFDMDAVLPP